MSRLLEKLLGVDSVDQGQEEYEEALNDRLRRQAWGLDDDNSNFIKTKALRMLPYAKTRQMQSTGSENFDSQLAELLDIINRSTK
jgi:hypothetical protein